MHRAGRALLGAACACAVFGLEVARADEDRVPVTVVVVGEGDAARRVERELEEGDDPDLEVRVADPLVRAEAAETQSASDLSRARAFALEGLGDECLAELGPAERVYEDLEAGDPRAATRRLFWRIVCHVSMSETASAERHARELTGLGFDVAELLDLVSPEVEQLIARVREEQASQPRRPVRVESTRPAAPVEVDGLPRCRTPCVVELPEGTHVVRLLADGAEVEHRRVTVSRGSPQSLRFDPTPATADEAARQWVTRYAGSPQIDSAPAMWLLARAQGAQNLVLLRVREEPLRLRGTLEADEELGATLDREPTSIDALGAASFSLLRDLLVRSGVLAADVPLYEEPIFWVITAFVAAVAATTTALAIELQPAPRAFIGVAPGRGE